MKTKMPARFLTASEIIRNRRLAMGYSQQEVATLLGVHIRQYQRLEYGERSIATASMMLGLSVCAVLKEQYQKRYNELEAQLNTAVERLSAIDQTVLLESARAVQKAKIREMLDDCSKHGLVTDFDESLFGAIVD